MCLCIRITAVAMLPRIPRTATMSLVKMKAQDDNIWYSRATFEELGHAGSVRLFIIMSLIEVL